MLPGFHRLYKDSLSKTCAEALKSPARYDIINTLLDCTKKRRYLEIGVRNPDHCFKRIQAEYKISVDPGLESKVNLADIKLTSDQFFCQLKSGKLSLLSSEFDVIFVDGLHLADQAYRDILNSMEILANPGYVVIHDCNPPTRFHAREDYREPGPAGGCWNGTTWKAIQRFRTENDFNCYVVDSDWGVGIIEKHKQNEEFRLNTEINPFFEYSVFSTHRSKILNLVSAADFKSRIEKSN
jgi:hypothetical protein